MAKDKDINIHVRTPDAQQAKRNLDEISRSGKKVGDDIHSGQRRAGDSLKDTSRKLGGMGRLLDNLKTHVLSFLGAWFGIKALSGGITSFIQKLERINQLQKDIYNESLSFLEVGQALEIQTGTYGKQQYWAKQAIEIQKAGALKDIGTAQQMMISSDITFGAMGGIRNQQVLNMVKELAPFVGAMGFSSEQVGTLFKFGSVANIAATPETYKEFFAKVLASYRASQSTDPGQFLTGLQKGGTAYITQGGTLEEALGLYSGAIKMTANESLAATLLERTARISSGGYERPRKAIEKALGVKWSDLSMNQRTSALLRYIGSIPESTRPQVLQEMGFAAELGPEISKLVAPGAAETISTTRQKVSETTSETTEKTINAYLGSSLGKRRINKAQADLEVAKEGPAFADWQERLEKAKKDLDILEAKGKDRWWIYQKHESTVMALESLLEEYDRFIPALSGKERERAEQLRADLAHATKMATYFPAATFGFNLPQKTGYAFSEALKTMQQANNITIHNDNSIHYYPMAGSKQERGIGPRTPPP